MRTPAEAGACCARAYSRSRGSSSVGGSGIPIAAAAIQRNRRLSGSVTSRQRDPRSRTPGRAAPPPLSRLVPCSGRGVERAREARGDRRRYDGRYLPSPWQPPWRRAPVAPSHGRRFRPSPRQPRLGPVVVLRFVDTGPARLPVRLLGCAAPECRVDAPPVAVALDGDEQVPPPDARTAQAPRSSAGGASERIRSGSRSPTARRCFAGGARPV